MFIPAFSQWLRGVVFAGLHPAVQFLGEWTSGRPTGLHLVRSTRTLCIDLPGLRREVPGGRRHREIHRAMLLHYQWHGCVGICPYVSICSGLKALEVEWKKQMLSADLSNFFLWIDQIPSNSSKILPAKQHGVERTWVCGTRCWAVVSVSVNEVSWWQTQSEHIIHDSIMTSLVLLLVILVT